MTHPRRYPARNQAFRFVDRARADWYDLVLRSISFPLRLVLLGPVLAAPAAWLCDWVVDGPAEAQAAIAVAYTLDELVKQTPEVIIARATERQSVWEKVGGSKRIVTYTKLEVSESVYGDAPSVAACALGIVSERPAR